MTAPPPPCTMLLARVLLPLFSPRGAGAAGAINESARPVPQAMAELLFQAVCAGKKVVEMVEDAKECEAEANQVAGRFVCSRFPSCTSACPSSVTHNSRRFILCERGVSYHRQALRRLCTKSMGNTLLTIQRTLDFLRGGETQTSSARRHITVFLFCAESQLESSVSHYSENCGARRCAVSTRVFAARV